MIKLNRDVFKRDTRIPSFEKYYIPNDVLYNSNENQFNMLDEYLAELKGLKVFVAGGAILSLLQNKKPRDIDFFFENESDYNCAWVLFESFYGEPRYKTKNALGFYDAHNDIMLELIHKAFGTPIQIVSNFDFTICAGAYYIEDDCKVFLTHAFQLSDIMSKQIRIVFDYTRLEPHQLLYRVLKYTGYGYHMEAYDMVNVIKAIKSKEFDIKTYQQIQINADAYETWLVKFFTIPQNKSIYVSDPFEDL